MTERFDLNEKMKDFGWSLYCPDSADKAMKIAGLLFVIYAHYDRSLSSFEKMEDKSHPEMKEYVKHWLKANGDNYDKETVEDLICHFGVAEVARIPKGKSYIDPKK